MEGIREFIVGISNGLAVIAIIGATIGGGIAGKSLGRLLALVDNARNVEASLIIPWRPSGEQRWGRLEG